MTTDELIAALEAAAGKATPGPWCAYPDDMEGNYVGPDPFMDRGIAFDIKGDDVFYIALANPANILALIAEMKRLKAENATLKEAYDDKVDGLSADLESAVEVAYRRGATEWTKLNYQTLYTKFLEEDGIHE